MAKKVKRNIIVKGDVSESIVGNNNIVEINNNKNIWTIIVGVFSIIGVVAGIFFGIKQIQKNKEEKINALKQNAIIAFEKKDFESAFNLFDKLKEELPNDSSGHYLFLSRVKDMLRYGGYDSNICELLNKACKLHNTKEVNDLLKNCK